MRRRYSALIPLALLIAAPSARAQTIVGGLSGDLEIRDVVDGLFNPTAAAFLPDGRLVIIQQNGHFLVWNGSGPAQEAGTLAVGYDGAERGLLGLAVDPMFATSNRLYFYYSAQGGQASNKNRVAWATIDPVTSQVDVAGHQDILTGIYGPANHNGGGVAFGPDGLLYIGAGDTGCNCGCAPGQADNFFGTCLTNLNGKIMRIDREGGIPATNPLVGVASVAACGANVGSCRTEPDQGTTGAPRTEIYAWGFRNPWRFTFDPVTDWLWIADVGEVTWEEVTISKVPGEHHGWPLREGFHGRNGDTCQMYTPDAVGTTCVEPVLEYNHSEGGGAASITGGAFSHHCSWPEAYKDRYWFADYVFNRIWYVTPNQARDGIDGERVLVSSNATSPVHFFEGPDGGIYFVSVDNGYVKKIVAKNPVQCTTPEPDAGVPDATAADPDALEGVDALEPGQDAIVNPPGRDATPGVDTVEGPVDAGGGGGGGESSGCGCSATGAGAAGSMFAVVMLGIVAVFRRRR